MTAKEILAFQFDEMVQTLKETLSFPSVKGDKEPDAPFGRANKDCLDFVLKKAESFGLDSYDCDGYAGHVDLAGTGEEVVGILGHLDVVPSKREEWIHDPYGGEIANGRLYGRGTGDDKGPMIACLYAVKALKESGFKPSKTVRLIFGCDEESGMECVEHYFSKVKRPETAFSPDGDFPVINREKGIYQFAINFCALPDGVTVSSGERVNVVPSFASATLPLDKNISNAADYGVTAETKDGSYILTAKGKSAHGSTPEEGINASHKILRFLSSVYPENATLSFLAEKLTDTTGKAWGIALSDTQSGSLTCSIGILQTVNGVLKATVDIRFPVTFTCAIVRSLLEQNTPYEMLPDHVKEPLFVPEDSELVSTLMSVYNDIMGTNCRPLAIGGGTYSRCLKNCVAFGPIFPGEIQTIHMPDENVELSNLKLMSELFLEAIIRLAE